MDAFQEDEAMDSADRGSAIRGDLTVDTTAHQEAAGDGSKKEALITPGTAASTPGTNFSGTSFSFAEGSPGSSSNEVEQGGDSLPAAATKSFIEQILTSINEPLPKYAKGVPDAIKEDESHNTKIPTVQTEDERIVTVDPRKESLVESRIKLSIINKYYSPGSSAD
eukprot:scaffold2686_cov267-Chaetoceros_neogracile.AAC.3